MPSSLAVGSAASWSEAVGEMAFTGFGSAGVRNETGTYLAVVRQGFFLWVGHERATPAPAGGRNGLSGYRAVY
jgi:hypothetical protein